MREMFIGGLLITMPGLVAFAFAVILFQNFWMVIAITASVLFTALPFAAAILLIRAQHRRERQPESRT